LNETTTRFRTRDKKTTASERGDVVSGNPSSDNLLSEGGEHLSHHAPTLPKDGAKLRRNTVITLLKAKKQNEVGLRKNSETAFP